MEKGMVSIIIPVYNCDKYLKRCVKSVLRQTYHNIEVFLLDDGSTDGSPEICDQFGEQDDRVSVFHLKNRGVSAVRNYGMKIANGEYIQFVDGDDYIERKMVATLVERMERESADMVVCNYKRLLTKWLLVRNSFYNPEGNYTTRDYMSETLRDAGHHYFGVVWNKLFKTNVITTNRLTFQEDVTLGEDFIFNMQYVEKVEKVTVIRDSLYCYNRLTNATLSKNAQPRLTDCEKEFFNRRKIYANYVNVLQRNGLYDSNKKQVEYYWIVFYVRQMAQLEMYHTTWSDAEISYWKEQMPKEREIAEVLSHYSKEEIDWKIQDFQRSSRKKQIVKNILGIQ